MGAPVHFEVFADDLERARKFYESTLGWTFERYPMPEEYWGITTRPKDQPGINGGMMKRMGPPPVDGQAVNAYTCAMDVASVDETCAKVEANGGKIVVPKRAIPTMGWIAYAKDTEGNIFGIWQLDAKAM